MDTPTMPPAYAERLVRVHDALQEQTGHTVSVAGLLEEALSEYLYVAELALELSPRGLPVREIDGKRYYCDERLGEYRNVENPHDRIAMT